EKALDTRSSIGVLGDMQKYQQYQMGQAMTAAAANPSGGGASEGMGMGMGFAMASQMVQGMQGAGAGTAAAAPPPPPGAGPVFHVTAGGQTFGPFSTAQLAQQVAAGQVGPQTLVWTAGMAGWAAAAQVPQLVGLFQQEPPPPPPQP
ncbi:MAG: DUF4339 domain-containing protein, partial [Acidobacteria bacterium]|nr:DUF4339 domain-containing protein [Acidobacteriota bacterium]